MNTRWIDRLPRVAFFVSLGLLAFTYGYLARGRGWFPHSLIVEAGQGLQLAREEVRELRPWYYYDSQETERTTVVRAGAMAPGFTFVTYLGADKKQFADVVDSSGRVVHRWHLDWFELWPDSTHLDADLVPKSPPGTLVNGALIMEDGGLIFNFDACGLIRVDACGRPVWRQPMRTHHTLDRDHRGHLWTSLRHRRHESRPDFPNYLPLYEDYTIVELSPTGEVLQEVSLMDLLQENDLTGLLYMSTRDENETRVGGDTLHVNDVEIFPTTMTPGFFQPGDVMVSMRTINTVAVFDLPRRLAKFVSTGRYVRQHDPDFIDGNTISVFDNNNAGRPSDGVYSRIVIETAPDGEVREAFTGSPELPFFTEIIGRHQWLPNGNLLLVESTAGRVLEVDPEGQLVWKFVNLIEPGVVGLTSDGIRLPPEMDADFFAQAREACTPPDRDK